MRIAPAIVVSDEDRRTLQRWARGRTTPARLVLRAKIVLLAAAGKLNKEIALELKTGMKTVCQWRSRFAKRGLMGIEKDAPRGARPTAATAALAAEILRKTTTEKPTGATHWSTRTLAAQLGTSPSMVQRVWKAHRLQPHRTKTFKLSNDPQFAEKLVDVVGLYLNPPEHAIVLCVDEKSQIQALDRTQKSLPIYPGRLGTMTHDYKRNGTTTLFAALNVAEGIVIEACMSRHRHPGVDQVSEGHRRLDRSDGSVALGGRQLRDAQTPESSAMARASPAVSHALYADQQFLAEPGGTLVSRPHTKTLAAWRLHQRPSTASGHLRVRRTSQRSNPRLPLEGPASRNPGQSPSCPSRPR